MQKLRGTGTTFSTTGQAWKPFRFNPRLAAKIGRLHRLKRKGLTGHETKAQMRVLAEQAVRDRD